MSIIFAVYHTHYAFRRQINISEVDILFGMTAMSWPEERHADIPWLYQVYQRWTFSYMDKLFHLGKSRLKDDGKFLTHDNLFAVPTSMQSKELAAKFR